MIDLGLWVTRLQNECLALDNQVFDMAEGWRVAEAPSKTPSAYVGPYRDEEWNRGDETSRYVQEVEAVISVLLVAREEIDPSSKVANMGDLQSLRKAVAQALFRWTPADCTVPIKYAGGQMVQWVTGKMHWADRYRTRYLLLADAPAEGTPLVHVTTTDTGLVAGNTTTIQKQEDGSITTEETQS